MTGPAPTICDNCRAVKGEGNKWLKGSGLYLGDNITLYAISFNAFLIGGKSHELDFCSEKCAHEMLSKIISGIRDRESRP